MPLQTNRLIVFRTVWSRSRTQHEATLPNRLFSNELSSGSNFPTSKSKSGPPRKMEELKANPFFGKYAEKLMVLQKSQPEVFLQRVAENKDLKDMERIKTEATTKRVMDKPSTSTKPVIKYSKDQKLADIMKLELLENQSAETVAEIWNSYHKSKEGYVSAVVPRSMYDKIVARASEFPIFLYPLPRSNGYEFFVAEFRGTECYFTQLLSYQAHKEESPPCLNVFHFEEMESKGIILMRGEFDKSVLNPLEVQCLLNQMQLYYGTEDQRKLKLVESFNKNPSSFQHMDLISEVEQSFTFAAPKAN